MGTKEEFVCMLEGERQDGGKELFTVYRHGKTTIIHGPGQPHIMHPGSRNAEEEIRIVYDIKIKRRSMDGQNWLTIA